MRYSLAILATALSPSLAKPVVKKANYDPLPGGDIDVLNYALTLEYLERKFYQQGLANYTRAQFAAAGFNETFYNNLQRIYFDEQSHVTFLSTALGAKAVHEATYSFPSTDVSSFLALASVLEGVGVSAYLGAAATIANKAYLTAAGSILTVEARHSAYLRAALHQVPFAKPFDTPLDFNAVFSLAAQFITGFAPGDPPLPFKAFPKLAIQPSQYPYTAGRSSVTFQNAYANAKQAGLVASEATKVYAVFFTGLDILYEPVRVTQGGKDYKVDKIPSPDCNTPSTPGTLGQVYVVLSTADGVGDNKVRDENTISGVGILEVVEK